MARGPRKKPKITLPGRNAAIEIAPVEVMDPYDGKPLTVMKNVRVHPLDTMLKHGKITDAQKTAGDKFLEIFDKSEIGGARAIDYERVKVDVSFQHRGIEPSVAESLQKLTAIHRTLGRRAFSILVQVIGLRVTPYDLAKERDQIDPPSRDSIGYFTTSFRLALDDLAEHFGVARGPERRGYVEKRRPINEHA